MPEILMPKRIVYGKNAADKLSLGQSEHTLILSDGGFLKSRGFLKNIERQVRRTAADVSIIINENVHDLYTEAAEVYFSREADRIIAVGGAGVIDCAMLLSNESNADFTAIPVSSACAMTDFENGRYFDYRKAPDCIVLDPSLMHCVNSAALAYDGLACLAYAMDALCENSNSIVYSIAFDGASGIIRNIIPSFRGNMEVLEKLMYSMYLCVAAHRNTSESDRSLFTRVSEFFSDFGYPKTSILAVCIPSVTEYESDLVNGILHDLSRALGISHSDDSRETAAAKMLDEIRRIQASLSIPRSISGFGLSSEKYNSCKNDADVPADLLDLCYHGSFKFMKL